MIRLLVNMIVFVFLTVIQTSFISSLPSIFVYTPVLLAVGIFLIQQTGNRSGLVIIVVFGIYLDLFSISIFPFETLGFLLCALSATLVSERLFANRSWYGLIACGMTGILALSLTRGLVLFFSSVWSLSQPSFAEFWLVMKWNSILLVVLLTVLFALTRPLRRFLTASFVLRQQQETLN